MLFCMEYFDQEFGDSKGEGKGLGWNGRATRSGSRNGVWLFIVGSRRGILDKKRDDDCHALVALAGIDNDAPKESWS
jgi:hypothetical protein